MRSAGARARIVVGTALAVTAWAAALACVPHPSADPTCQGSTVKGERGAVFVTPTGEQPRTFKANLTVAALLPLPGDGRGYTTCPGSDDGNGHLSVANVPESFKYYFQLGTTYVETSQRDVDFTSYFLGRPDATAAKLVTDVSLQGSNMESWSSMNDSIELFSWGARTYHFGVETLGSGAPIDGATSLSLTFDWSHLSLQRLLDASKGDQLMVLQYANRTITGGSAQVAVKQLTVSNATLQDGGSATLSGSFADLSLSRSFSINWARSAFDALAADTAPDALSSTQSFFVVAEPEAARHGDYDFGVDLLDTGFSTVGAFDHTLGANVFVPPGFDALVDVSEDFSLSRTFRGASERVRAFVFVQDLLDHVDRGTVSPVAGPVKSPKLDGKDAFTVQSGAGTTPVVSWTPAMGADVVRVVVNHMITTSSGTVGHEAVATIFTGDSTVQIPDGILKSGETYYLFLDAINAAGVHFDQKPLQFGTPTTIVRIVTQTFTP